MKWFRQGSKERIERKTHAATNWAIAAYDGLFVRTLENPKFGAIETLGGAHWTDTNQLTPYSMLYEFQRVPYSSLLRRATEVGVEQVEGAERVRVRFRHPDIASISFDLQFDSEGRLMSRDILVRHPDRHETPWERHEFTGFRNYPHPSGEPIWFPSTATYRYFVGGALVDGAPVEYSRTSVKFSKLEFAVDLPDELFTVRFPKGCTVYDGANRMGTILGEYPADDTPPSPKPWRLWISLVALAGAITLIVRWAFRHGKSR